MAEGKKYYINAQGESVEVSKEIYLTYYRMARKARWVDEKDRYNGTVLFSNLDTRELLAIEMFQDQDAVSVEAAVVGNMMVEKLRNCLQLLSDDEINLIRRRYWDQISQTELASELQVSQQVISYREKQILGKLKKLLEK